MLLPRPPELVSVLSLVPSSPWLPGGVLVEVDSPACRVDHAIEGRRCAMATNPEPKE